MKRLFAGLLAFALLFSLAGCAQKAETAKRMEAIAARKVAERRQREAEEAMQRAEEAEARLAPSDPPADTDKS